MRVGKALALILVIGLKMGTALQGFGFNLDMKFMIEMRLDAFSTNWTLGGALNGPSRIGFALPCILDSVVGKTKTTCLIVYSLPVFFHVSNFGFFTTVMVFYSRSTL